MEDILIPDTSPCAWIAQMADHQKHDARSAGLLAAKATCEAVPKSVPCHLGRPRGAEIRVKMAYGQSIVKVAI
jgi:molybdenum cofactor biosynthesis enzyme